MRMAGERYRIAARIPRHGGWFPVFFDGSEYYVDWWSGSKRHLWMTPENPYPLLWAMP